MHLCEKWTDKSRFKQARCLACADTHSNLKVSPKTLLAQFHASKREAIENVFAFFIEPAELQRMKGGVASVIPKAPLLRI